MDREQSLGGGPYLRRQQHALRRTCAQQSTNHAPCRSHLPRMHTLFWKRFSPLRSLKISLPSLPAFTRSWQQPGGGASTRGRGVRACAARTGWVAHPRRRRCCSCRLASCNALGDAGIAKNRT